MSSNTHKRERFEVVASRRVQKTIDALESLSKCSNRHNYEYNKQDVDKMMAEIKAKLRIMEINFRDGLETKKSKFKF